MAVFYGACPFDCLYCQNWQFRGMPRSARRLVPAEELAAHVDGQVACICFFGGDPVPQLPHAFQVCGILMKTGSLRVRICWETCGYAESDLLDRMVEFSLRSGGIIKFDLKAWSPAIHRALCGADNQQVLANFSRAAKRIAERPEVPLVVASTLLVPGYIDAEEVRCLARFIASHDPGIPYALLAFHPDFEMRDLPRTPATLASECLLAARESGLTRVRLGNVHLLE